MKKMVLRMTGLVLLLALSAVMGPVPGKAGSAEDAIIAMLKNYVDSLNRQNLTDHIACFASRVQWFGKSLSREELRKILAKDFAKYTSMAMVLSDVRVYASGQSAYVVCNKEWYFCNDNTEQAFCGEVRARFGFVRERGEWKINSVQDLKTKWVKRDYYECGCGGD